MSQFPDVPVTDVADDAAVLDIREQDEWDAGHAPNAVHIPMNDLPVRLDELAPFLDRDEPLVVTCRSGGRVSRVLPWLEQQGYDVANMEGGMRAWHAEGKPLEGTSGQPTII
ncbi:rhodanese-like domain-containing protein [Phycicoccus sp. BSK3Z-2]|uniref:Rhodanese-like domain-containing protein n=1 Tax=Phycicoccus avicenniae TaxID=2828860 RepID=A0A941DA33_9MICO|nr:rhodanese-like domain-containing protein [Phycicoccus avicenniae]MBR7744316.1 rhodanese-like domain-containing protein [Phycicoccus avicenniae]